MKYSLDIIKKEIANSAPKPKDLKLIAEKSKKTIKYLEDNNIFPPNETIQKALVSFLVETKLKCRDKGLFLAGGVGTGKTFASKIISSYKRYEFYEAVMLRDMYEDEHKRPRALEIARSYTEPIIIDDVGAEPTIKDFGVTIESLEILIAERSKAFDRTGVLTVITTNLSPEQFSKRYGDRIFSRINQMCECFVCNGTDLRLKH